MAIYKRGHTYWIDYYHNGKRTREAVGTRAEARIVLAERTQDIRQGRDPSLRQIKPMPFREMVTEYLTLHAKQKRDYQSFVFNTKILLRHFGDRTLQEIDAMAIKKFIAGRQAEGVSNATINRQRACLSGIFRLARDWGYYGGPSPLEKVPAFEESPGRLRYLSPEEADRLLEAAGHFLWSLILLALHTGARRGEALALSWSSVDLDRRIVIFEKETTKSGKRREVPMSPELEQMFRERRKLRAISGDAREFVFTWQGRRIRSFGRSFAAAGRRAKLDDDVTYHTLRHTFASWYMMNGGDLFRLQRYMGHATIALTQRYAHLSPEYLGDGVRFIGAPKGDGHKTVTTAPPAASAVSINPWKEKTGL